MSWFDWEHADKELLAFTRRLVELRREHPVFRRRGWFQGRPIRPTQGSAALPDIAWLDARGQRDDRRALGPSSCRARSRSFSTARHRRARRARRAVLDDSFLIVFHARPRGPRVQAARPRAGAQRGSACSTPSAGSRASGRAATPPAPRSRWSARSLWVLREQRMTRSTARDLPPAAARGLHVRPTRRELVPYLAELGVTHLYLSPILQAAEGSTHGYDVVDPDAISAELGGDAGVRGARRPRAHARGLGILLDIVPNHMAIAGTATAGGSTCSRTARPATTRTTSTSTGPARRRSRARCRCSASATAARSTSGALARRRTTARRFAIRAGDARCRSRRASLGRIVRARGRASRASRARVRRRRARGAAAPHAPTPRRARRRHRDKAVLLRRLAELREPSERCAAALGAEVAAINADPAELDACSRRRTTGSRTGASRPPAVLPAVLRRHDARRPPQRGCPTCSTTTTRCSSSCCATACSTACASITSTACAIPAQYLDAPARARARRVDRRREDPRARRDAAGDVADRRHDRLRLRGARGRVCSSTRPARRCSRGSTRSSRATAFDVAAEPSRCAPRGDERCARTASVDAADRARRARMRAQPRVPATSPAPRSSARWPRCSRASRSIAPTSAGRAPDARSTARGSRSRDRAMRPTSIPISSRSSRRLLAGELAATPCARARDRACSRSPAPSSRRATRTPRSTGYVRARLALNEVGARSATFGCPPRRFHRELARRRHRAALLATSTHDTKRSEDARARIAVLSEIPDAWRGVRRGRWRDARRAATGAVPRRIRARVLRCGRRSSARGRSTVERAVEYARKAAREARRRTSWRAPDEAYEAALTGWSTRGARRTPSAARPRSRCSAR